MTTPYTTLARVQAEIKSSVTTDNAKLFDAILRTSARIDNLMGRRSYFAPMIATRTYTLTADRVNSYRNTFALFDNLLSLTALTVGSSTLTVGTDVEAFSEDGDTPYRHLRLLSDCDSWYTYCSTARVTRLSVTGIWGYRRSYTAEGWLKVDDIADAGGINASVTSFTAAAVDGSDPNGYNPRLSAGNLLRLESEYVNLLSTDTGANTGAIKRAANGSTAAAHAAGVDIDVWQVEEAIVRAATRGAAFMYERRGAYESATVDQMGTTINFPSDVLREVYLILEDLQYG